MAETLTYAGTLVVRTCWCGIRHAIPEELGCAANRDKSMVVFCPVGHKWVSGTHEKRESEQLRDRLQRERDRAGRLASERDQLSASLRGTKANAARTRKELKSVKARVAAGTCPCCNRTFQQLARHMARQHPQFAPESA